MLESRVIGKFSEALEQQDLETLKEQTSDEFARKALRRTEALDDFRLLRLPDEEPTVVDVEDVSNHEKNVTVNVGESERRLLYKLTRDPQTRRWVIDDIYMKQKKQGVTAVKSVTEQMDLLLSIREFLAAWQDGGRNDVMRVVTPEFGRQLAKVPPAYLARLTRSVAGPTSGKSPHQPTAQLDEDVAVVRLPRPTGELVVSYRLQSGVWRADDVAVETRTEDERIPSVKNRARILFAALAFLDAYSRSDKQALPELCTDPFLECLMPADLASVSLPHPDAPVGDYRVRDLDEHATFVLPGGEGLVKIALQRQSQDKGESKQSAYLVEDVTVYEPDGGQEKQLSALFTAQAVVQLFAESLAERNLAMLRRLSTPDFGQRVWQRLDETQVRELALGGIEPVRWQPKDVHYRGAVTEMTVTQGPLEMTYVLRNWNGKLRVDDVRIPIPGRPTSLKMTLELIIPIQQFAAGLRTEQLRLLQRHSSADFNRLVWTQVQEFPNLGVSGIRPLLGTLESVELDDEQATVRVGDERNGAVVRLVREHDQWVVDDALLILGPDPSQRHELKKTLRLELAQSFRTLNRRRALQPQEPAPSPDTVEVADGRSPFEAIDDAGPDPEPQPFLEESPSDSRAEAFDAYIRRH